MQIIFKTLDHYIGHLLFCTLDIIIQLYKAQLFSIMFFPSSRLILCTCKLLSQICSSMLVYLVSLSLEPISRCSTFLLTNRNLSHFPIQYLDVTYLDNFHFLSSSIIVQPLTITTTPTSKLTNINIPTFVPFRDF